MDNTNKEETIACMAVGDMLGRRIEEYKDALASGADGDVIDKMGEEIEAIEKVYDSCKTAGSDYIKEANSGNKNEVKEVVSDE